MVDFKIGLLWMFLAAVFIIGEIFTAGFFLLWFGIAAAIGGLLAFLGLSIGWQLGVFVFVSGVLLIFSRRFAEKVSKKSSSYVGAERLIGKKGIVIEEINPAQNKGFVRVEQEKWRAKNGDSKSIPKGKKVKVIKMEGAHLIVEVV